MIEASADKLQILFFSHYFPPEGNAPASRVHALCRRWVEDGCDVSVVTCAPNVPNGRVYEGYRNKLTQTEHVDGIRVIRVWTVLAPNAGVGLRTLNFISYMLVATLRALFLPRPDVIIATSPQFFCGWAGVLTKWLRRRPLVLEIRDIWPESIAAVGAMRRKLLIGWLERLESQMYRAATHVVVVGEGYRNQLLAKNVPAERISVIPNGADRELFDVDAEAATLRQELGLADSFICAYAGTIGMASALDVTLRAGALLKERGRNDVVLLMIGDGAVRAQLEDRARELGLRNVIFMGRQEKSAIPGLIAASDCCLVHLRRAALFRTVLPSKIFEALAMERPIVLGVQGHAARVLEAAGGGLMIDPEDEVQLVDALARLQEDPELRARMGARGRAYVLEHYDRDVLARSYLAILRDVALGREHPHRPGAREAGEPPGWKAAPQ